MTDEIEDSKRVAQVWPLPLWEQVRDLAGSRGVTEYTLKAVREKLANEAGPAPSPAAPAPAPSSEPALAPQPSTPMERDPMTSAPVPDPALDNSVAVDVVRDGPDYRGEKVEVATTPTLGVAAKFSSSTSAVEALMAKAREMGVKSASEIPPPVRPSVAEHSETEGGGEPAPAPTPPAPVAPPAPPEPVVEQPVAEPVQATPPPPPAPLTTTPIALRQDLDDIDVDF